MEQKTSPKLFCNNNDTLNETFEIYLSLDKLKI